MKIKWAFVASLIITLFLIATIVLIVIHPTYFKISQPITPHPYFHVEVRGDEFINGNSEGKWINKDIGSWQCSFGYKLEYPLCYYQIYLGNGKDKGLDLSMYSEVELNIEHQGDVESLTIYMRNYNSEFSIIHKDYNSTKYMRVEVDTNDFDSQLSVDLKEFMVADWWLERHKLPRHLRFQSFKNIILFGIQVQPKKTTQQIQKITVSSITMKGVSISKEQLYFYIITFWSSVILMIVLFQFIRMLNVIGRRDKSLTKLKKDNIHLYEQKESFEQLAKIDPLTQIFNRAGIDSYIEKQVLINPDDTFIIGLLDVDYFKKLNDAYGHDSGDEVLKKIASTLKGYIRKNDCIGRWGGEEFLLILPNISLHEAYQLTNKIRIKIQKNTFNLSHIKATPPTNVTISIGLSQAKNSLEIYESIKVADFYLYKAKDNGRNRVEMKE